MALGEELRAMGGNVAAVIARAEAREMELIQQVEIHMARADTAVINADNSCSLLEQKYLALVAQTTFQDSEKSQLSMLLESKSTELAQAQSQMNQLELQLIKLRTEVESRDFELKEAHASKKELLDTVALKNTELESKNASMSAYLDKVLALTEEKSNLEGRILEHTTESVQARAREARMEQEKDITAQHNSWLNQDLSAKVTLLLEERQRTADLETALQSKISEIERVTKEKDEALLRSQESVKDLEAKLQKRITELNFFTEDFAAKQELLSNECATATRLAELYKQSSEEWSKKTSELEGVIKALKAHLTEVESESEDKIRKEVEARQALEKQAASEKDALEKKIAELERSRTGGGELLQFDSRDLAMIEASVGNEPLPSLPIELSGTALAASLLRDGWTVVKLYGKCQEAVDALRHEKHERTYCQNLLNRVLREIEEKAEVILEERAEYRRMVEAYKTMEENLKFAVSDQSTLETTIKELKAELRKRERDVKNACKDVSDLQNEVSVLLKECSDIQKRHGIGDTSGNDNMSIVVSSVPDSTSSDAVISEKLMTFKDIHELVEHNTKIRSLLRVLANENEEKERSLKDKFDSELKKHIDSASEKVISVLQKADEQSQMIESLRGTIGMYKRLYEDERRVRSSLSPNTGAAPHEPGHEEHDVRRLMDMAQEEIRRELKKATEQIASLEEELTKARHDISVARTECSRSQAQASFAGDQLASLRREFEEKRKQNESILMRNMELSQNILDFQRRLKESQQHAQTAEEQARRYSIEISVLEREKTLLANAEKQASLEASQLSDRVHRLQAKLATIESAEEAREILRASERKKLEDDINRLQRDWVEAKHQLELERNHVATLNSQRDKAIGQATERVEALTLELKGAAARSSNFEIRAKVAESRCAELESSLKKADEKFMSVVSGGKRKSVPADTNAEMLEQSREEVTVLKEELAAVKGHAEQYKSLAMTNEEALRELQEAHRRLQNESTTAKSDLDSELKMLQKQLTDVETHALEKEREAGAIQANNESLLRDALKELALVRDAEAAKQIRLEQSEERIRLLGEEVERQRVQWRTAQNNYERQVLLQAETIRELDAASERLNNLESEGRQLRETSSKAEIELESVKVAFYMEKDAWRGKETALDNRIKELELQNSLLLDRLEARHVKLAEQERNVVAGDSSSADAKEEADLQNIINYLRRAKEAADTEISLLKQERTRLNKQFEAASKAAEDAQTRLRQHHEKIQASLYSEEEFRALQTQVMELNLLIDNNAQLKEENKKASEDAAKVRDQLKQLEEEKDSWTKSLREKELELESTRREIDFLKSEVDRWQQRVTQILAKYKALDVDDYERVKKALTQYEEQLKKFHDENRTAQDDTRKAQDDTRKAQAELDKLQKEHQELTDSNKKLQETESNIRAEAERLRRLTAGLKRKSEADKKNFDAEVTRRLEECKASMEKSFEAKHHEEIEAAKLEVAARSEQSFKESAARYEQIHIARIQILEKTLEKEREELRKEREELRKEKLRREKDRKTFMEMAKNLKQEKQDNGQRQQPPIATNPSTSETTTLTIIQATPEQVAEPAARISPEVEAQPSVPVPGGVGPSSEKDRQMQELRASIIEKEKSQARKPQRPRIIRPRIDISTQPGVPPSDDVPPSEVPEPDVPHSEVPEPDVSLSEVPEPTETIDIDTNTATVVGQKRNATEAEQANSQHDGNAPAKKPRPSEAVFEPESTIDAEQVREKTPEPNLDAEPAPDADMVEGEEVQDVNEAQVAMVTDEHRDSQVAAEVINDVDTGLMEIGDNPDYPEDGEISAGGLEEEAAALAEAEVAEQEHENEGDGENMENVEELEEAKNEVGELVEEQQQQQQQVTESAGDDKDVVKEAAGEASGTTTADTTTSSSTIISLPVVRRRPSPVPSPLPPTRGRAPRPGNNARRRGGARGGGA